MSTLSLPPRLPHPTDDELDGLKRHIQGFAANTVLIVGSGLSLAEGISGMSALAQHLLATVPKQLPPDAVHSWQPIADNLARGIGLEDALLRHPPTPVIEKIIVAETFILIRADEAKILKEVVQGDRVLRLTRLLRCFADEAIYMVTPNYDRLGEAAAECVGLGVDTMFVGNCLGRYDEDACKLSFVQEIRPERKSYRRIRARRLVLSKPHGSLDWCWVDNKPIRVSPDLNTAPLIITPGHNKYLHGYSVPFDRHRERANKAIDDATAFMIVGYGFNDDHLETHLGPAIRNGKPTLIVTYELSIKAHQLIKTCPNVTALERGTQGGVEGTIIWHNEKQLFLPGINLWDLGDLVKEAFGG